MAVPFALALIAATFRSSIAITGCASAHSVVSLCSQSLRCAAIRACTLPNRSIALRRFFEPFTLRETLRWTRFRYFCCFFSAFSGATHSPSVVAANSVTPKSIPSVGTNPAAGITSGCSTWIDTNQRPRACVSV